MSDCPPGTNPGQWTTCGDRGASIPCDASGRPLPAHLPQAMTTVHVVPRGDLVEHQQGDDCPCGPRPEPVERVDGSIGWVVVHHSIDGREQTETTSGGGGSAT